MLRMRIIAPAIALGAVAAAAAPGSTAIAAPTASYKHWSAAQKAAGFPLLRPGKTLGLKSGSLINVRPCHPVGNPGHKRLVIAVWAAKSQVLELAQTDSATFCGDKLPGHHLGTYTVHGTTAHLYGLCGRNGQPPCTSRNIVLYLRWTTHRVLHISFSVDEWRPALVRFARGLHPVR